MPSITYDRFEAGIDRRKGASVSDPNRLRNLQNTHVTTGWQIRGRPGTTRVATLVPGTVGLFPFNGLLNTVQGPGAAIDHGNALFAPAIRADHPLATLTSPARISAEELFNGFPYIAVEYDNGDTFHHYIDTDPTWALVTSYGLGAYIQPSASNGYRYKATVAGTSGGTEPAWPLGVGQTIADGTVTWTCESKYIVDGNCPHTPSLTRNASKIWAPGKSGSDVIRFCATDAPRDWTTAGDAGFLPTGLKASGDPVPRGVGRYRKKLSVTMRDSTQTWVTDPDPALNAIDDVVDLGTIYPESFANIAQDLYMLTDVGFRSISTLADITANLQDIDIGSPVDDLVLQDIKTATNPIGIYYRGGGQYWCHIGAGKVWVYTLSRISKLAAWSFYQFPFTIDAMAQLANVLYLRAADVVYKVDPDVGTDDGTQFQIDILFPFLNMKRPGQLKQILGADFVFQGEGNVSYLYDANDPSLETTPRLIKGDTRPEGLVPVELTATEIAPHITYQGTGTFQFDMMTFYYDILGAL